MYLELKGPSSWIYMILDIYLEKFSLAEKTNVKILIYFLNLFVQYFNKIINDTIKFKVATWPWKTVFSSVTILTNVL